MSTSLRNFIRRFDVSFSTDRIKIAEPYYKNNDMYNLVVIHRDVFSYSLYAYNNRLFCTYLDIDTWNKKYAYFSKDPMNSAPPPEIIICEVFPDRSYKEVSRVSSENDIHQAIESYVFPF